MNNNETAGLTDQLASLQAEYDDLKKDRDEWEKIAELRMREINRLRQVIRELNQTAMQ